MRHGSAFRQLMRFRVAGVVALLLYLAAPAMAERFLLGLNPGGDLSTVTSTYGLMLVRPVEGAGVFLVSGPDPTPADLVTQVLSDPNVSQFEPDHRVHSPESQPNAKSVFDPNSLEEAIQNRRQVTYYGSDVRGSYSSQPAGDLIGLPAVLGRYASGEGIVAIIDTGVDPEHPALKNVLVPGYDFTRDQAGYGSELPDLDQSTVAILDQSTVAILDSKTVPMVLNQSTVAILDQSTVAILDGTTVPTDFGHGTMVAGLIHLVAPTAQIMALKAFNADGSADISDIVSAIYYAVDHQAKVINMSFSSRVDSPTLTAALQYAASHDVICIASAGNDGRRLTVYPAANRGVIGVGSTSAQDQRSAFSNYGTRSVEISAPGEALITTYPGNNYAVVWGTSFSTALTSGAVAVLSQIRPGIEPEEVSEALEHGHRLDFEGMGEARLDVMSTVLYCLLNR